MFNHVVARIWFEFCEAISECYLGCRIILELNWVHLLEFFAHQLCNFDYCMEFQSQILWILIINMVIIIFHAFLRVFLAARNIFFRLTCVIYWLCRLALWCISWGSASDGWDTACLGSSFAFVWLAFRYVWLVALDSSTFRLLRLLSLEAGVSHLRVGKWCAVIVLWVKQLACPVL